MGEPASKLTERLLVCARDEEAMLSPRAYALLREAASALENLSTHLDVVREEMQVARGALREIVAHERGLVELGHVSLSAGIARGALAALGGGDEHEHIDRWDVIDG